MALNWQNGMEGSQMVNPFNEREYVTLTGFDSVKNQVSFKDPRGKSGTIGGGAINVDGISNSGTSKAKATKSVTIGKPSRAPYNETSGVITPSTEQAQEAESPAKGATEGAKTTAQVLQDQDKSYRNAQKAIAGAEFIVDVINANSAYNNANGQAQINIMMARNSANDAIYRGRQAALDRQSEGFNAGNDASLAMAAQGQDVRGHATQKLKGSYEAMGYENAAREEINSIREAMGYQLEEINYDYLREMAGINRDNAIAGSFLKTAVTIAAL